MIERAARNFLAQLATLGLALVERIVLAGLLVRFWGADRFGEWALLLSFAGLIFLAEVGLNVHYGNAWQRMAAGGDRTGIARLARVALGLALGQGAMLLPALLLFVFWTEAGAEDRTALLLLGLSAIANVMRGSVSQLYRVDNAFARGTLIAMVPTLGTVLGGFATVLAGGGVTVLAALHLLAQLGLGWGLLFADLRHRCPWIDLRPALPARVEAHEILHGVKWLAPQQMAPVAWLQAPLLILGALGITGAPLAGFVLMRTLTGFSRQIVTMASQAAALELVGARHRGETATLRSGLDAVTRLACIGVAASGAALLAFGPNLVSLWTGDAALFDPGVMVWLALGALFAAPAMPLANLLTYSGQARIATEALAAQIASALIIAGVLTPAYGVAGMAAGLALGEGIGLCFLASRLPGRMPWRTLMLCGGSVVWCLVVSVLVLHVFPAATAGDLALGLVAWGLIGPLPLLAFALRRDPLSDGLSRFPRSIRPAALRSASENANS
ncbi:MAG: polysaccharide biosynthesis C-terminal domain-containing protein [Methylobacterium mesophilicum]|nr:polysaccharide biosynthesis C-terminal domain-containing protein [Methylobacterium mesophilicum]